MNLKIKMLKLDTHLSTELTTKAKSNFDKDLQSNE